MEVARRVGDQHALAELSSAKLNLEMEDMWGGDCLSQISNKQSTIFLPLNHEKWTWK
jgi:hypothetical protein